MEPLQRIWTQSRDRWTKLTSAQRMAASVLAAAVVGALAFAAAMQGDPAYDVLFGNLSDDDAARIVMRLKEGNVAFRIDADGHTILVPGDKVHETRLMLAGEGMPNGGGVGFEIFDSQRFGESEFSEQVKYHRALEGELARTINHITGVESARVHLVLQNRTLFARDRTSASASVALKLAPGIRLQDPQVAGIVHLVASSVRGLEPANVTVVDSHGTRLSNAGQDQEGHAGNALEFKRDLEQQKERAIQELLDIAVGPGKSVVRVDADVNFAREERTEEKFDPETVAARSFQITDERSSTDTQMPAGIPGAPSNLPGAVSNTTGSNSAGTSRHSETRNFEVSKVVKHTVEPLGRITRLHVATIVDGTWTAPAKAGGKPKFTPLPAAELAKLKAVIASAVGAMESRGDQVTVECVPFPDINAAAAPHDPIAALIAPYEHYLKYVGIGLGVVAGLVLFFVIRRRMKSLMLTLSSGQPGGIPVNVNALPLGNDAAGALASGDPAAAAAAALPALKASNAQEVVARFKQQPTNDNEELRRLVGEVAANDPDQAARIIRNWLQEAA